MSKTLRMELIEARQGKPITEVLADLYAEHGRVAEMAEALGITRQAVYLWMKLLGITTDDLRRLVRERDGKDEATETSL